MDIEIRCINHQIRRAFYQFQHMSFLQDRFFDEWDGGFNLGWELDFWGRYRRAIELDPAGADGNHRVRNARFQFQAVSGGRMAVGPRAAAALAPISRPRARFSSAVRSSLSALAWPRYSSSALYSSRRARMD